MTREENLYWIDQEIKTWENECQSKHPIKEALYAARKALEREPRIGYWVKKSQYGNDYCSECDCELLLAYKPKYCPNCGAKMRKVR